MPAASRQRELQELGPCQVLASFAAWHCMARSSGAWVVALLFVAWPTRSRAYTASATSEACSLNGFTSTDGKCVCQPAWEGANCSRLHFMPSKKESGYRQIFPAGRGQNRSSWGGGGWFDETTHRWFMWVSELADGCGMATWTTNSRTVRASSPDPLGEYTREAVQIPTWTHESTVTRGPGGEWVVFMSYAVPPKRPICHGCAQGSTNPNCSEPRAPLISDFDPTYMTWCPAGKVEDPTAWSTPVLILSDRPQMDTNFAAVINEDGSLVGMWRDHFRSSTLKGKSTIHLAHATDWKDNSTYTATQTDVLFGDAGLHNPGGVEDPFLWVDETGHFHALFHMLFPAHPYSAGGHAFSKNGLNWTWTGEAYDGNVTYTDGSHAAVANGDRPHLLFDKNGKTPVALTTAAGTGWGAPGMDTDQTYTLLRPLRQAA